MQQPVTSFGWYVSGFTCEKLTLALLLYTFGLHGDSLFPLFWVAYQLLKSKSCFFRLLSVSMPIQVQTLLMPWGGLSIASFRLGCSVNDINRRCQSNLWYRGWIFVCWMYLIMFCWLCKYFVLIYTFLTTRVWLKQYLNWLTNFLLSAPRKFISILFIDSSVDKEMVDYTL